MTAADCTTLVGYGISTHTPLTGRDFILLSWRFCSRFLLTRPLRDVTNNMVHRFYWFHNFYSHAPYGTWPCRQEKIILVVLISTHTPLTGRDSNPMWYKGGDNISTHTPLTGRDMLSSALNSCPKIFLLTRPLRDVTPDEPKPDEPKPISTHTPLTGRDCFWGGRFSKRFHFYSHAPYGTWPISPIQNTIANGNFYSHAPYGTWLELLKVFYLNLAFLLTRPLRDVTS